MQNTVGKRNLEELERPNFGTDQMLETGKKNHLDLKFKLEAGGCIEDCKTKKNSSKKWDYWIFYHGQQWNHVAEPDT